MDPRDKPGDDGVGIRSQVPYPFLRFPPRQNAIACCRDMLYTMIEVIRRSPKWLKAPAISKAQHVCTNIIERSSHARA